MDRFIASDPLLGEILAYAKDRYDSNQELSPVESTVLREWLSYVAARRNELELHAQHDFMSDEAYAELHALRETLIHFKDAK